jgi:hypothetical protein
MDWPSEVVRGSEFTVRLVVGWPCFGRNFQAGQTVDQSAVTYAPHFLVDEGSACPIFAREVSIVDVLGSLDTADVVFGLPADFPRTYEMRAVSSVYANTLLDALPNRTFGEITVRTTLFPPSMPTPPRNAAGFAYAQRDSTGCMRITPTGLFAPRAAMALENPPDTTTYWWGFVRGEIQPVAACGAFRTFHLVSRN